MSELIDRQEVLKVIREMSYIGLMEKEALLDAVKGILTIKIMGCKDCRCNVGNGGKCHHCDDTRFFVDERHRPLYCQYGKQKEVIIVDGYPVDIQNELKEKYAKPDDLGTIGVCCDSEGENENE